MIIKIILIPYVIHEQASISQCSVKLALTRMKNFANAFIQIPTDLFMDVV